MPSENINRDIAYHNYKKVKEKYANINKEEYTKEIFLELLYAAIEAAQFDDIVDLENMKIKYNQSE